MLFLCGSGKIKSKGKIKWIAGACQSIRRETIKEKFIRAKKKRNTKNECNSEETDGIDNSSDSSEFVEFDPTGRYGRYNDVLGKGASKTVYRAFDEYEGIEVAWNQVKLNGLMQSPEDLERLYSEIHLLKTLTHKNIMKFYTYWVDVANRKINFITEMFTSGNLKQYRLKHRRVNIRALKNWCRQILSGLHYLHSQDPPVIHRDLKCDNIFVNGSQGEIKIGDLGLAAILKKSHKDICVGTPEFMAPEVYKEDYNELVDIYSFGMCVLEMVTFEYPYSECASPAQIYLKIISGKKPDAFYKVMDPELRQFVEKCLATVSLRLSARELLDDPFLRTDKYEFDRHMGYGGGEADGMAPPLRQPLLEVHGCDSPIKNGHPNGFGFEAPKESGYHRPENESSGIELFDNHDDEHFADVDISINGKRREDGSIFLRLRIADKEGHVRRIYFPFEMETDTALSVATEMVAELDITDQDVTKIANMIDREIVSLVPQWKPGPTMEETFGHGDGNLCGNSASNHTSYVSFVDFTATNPDSKDSQFHQFCSQGCSSVHGRFEEITFKADEPEHHVKEVAAKVLSQTDCLGHQEIEDQHGRREVSSDGSSRISDEYYDTLQSIPSTDEESSSAAISMTCQLIAQTKPNRN